MNKEKGFTMIELVMVIVIIGILAAIAIPKFMDLRNSARQAACRQSGGALRAAISNYYASNMINSPSNPNKWPRGGANFATDLTPYVQAWPAAPVSGTWDAAYTAATGVLDLGTGQGDDRGSICPKQ